MPDCPPGALPRFGRKLLRRLTFRVDFSGLFRPYVLGREAF